MKDQLGAIQKLAADLELAQAAHKAAVVDLEKVRQLCGQQGYAVTVNGVRIDVAENGGRDTGWSAKMIRGREMIHLGAIKALQAVVDRHANTVKQLEALLKRSVAELSP